jgi:hypothetical protein
MSRKNVFFTPPMAKEITRAVDEKRKVILIVE